MAADLGAKFVRLNAAKRAAADLRERASNCKVAYLREEGDSIVNEALLIIRQIEDKAIDPNCNLLDETIGKAALKAEDVLRKLEGRIAASERKGKSGNLFSKLSKQLTNPDRQIFKDARDALKLVLPCMTEASDAALTESEDESVEQQEQQQQHASLDSSGSTEQRWSYTKGNTKVSTVALIPGLDGSIARSTLWVCLNKKVEFYVGCNPNTKSEVVLPDKGQAVTCVSFDKLGGVWTGHADGSVWIHLQGTWCAAQHPTSVGLPIRSMTFDHKGYCWVGDDAGIIRVLVFDPNTGRMSCRIHLAPPQTQNLMMVARQQGPAAAAAAFNASNSSSSLSRLGSGSSSTLNRSSAVAAIISKGLAVLSSGGEWANSITLWHSANYQKLEVSSCDSYGATCSFALLPWAAPAAGDSADSAQEEAYAVAGVPASGIAVGYAAAPIATVPARIMAASAAKQSRVPATGLVAGRAADPHDYNSWRLLSGHERGQVLLWQLHGVTRSAAATKLLQLLTVIGEARPQHGVRGMALFEDLSMLALVHTTGALTALPLPTATNGAVATNTTSGASFYAVGVPAGRPAAPGTGGTYAATPHCWVPPAARIKAHKHPVVAAATLGELLVTASSNTVKSWTADQLKVEAQGEGLMFSRSSKVSQQVATADALAAAIAAADSSSSTAAPVTPTRGEAGDRAAAAAAAVASAAATSDSQQSVLVLPQQSPAGAVATAESQAHDAYTDAREASMSAFLESEAVASDASSSLPVPASCTAANPMSRENAQARGLQVDATGVVVLKQHSAEAASTFPVYPMSAMPMSYPAMPAIGTEYSAGQAVPSTAPDGSPAGLRPPLSHAQSTPVGHAGLTAGSSSGGLDTSSSVSSDGIKVHHIICNSELVLKEVIGSGAEGKVYRGTWTNIDIAAKEYLAVDDMEGSSGSYDSLSESAMQRAKNALHKEVGLLTSLNHPNLVRFCGVCLDPPLVVMEYYKFGNVFSLLEKARIQWQMHQANPSVQQKSKQPNKYMNYLTWDRRLEMLHDVAAGMMYLHKRHYVHGDLRSPNLFVGQDGRVKIGDFGFTKRLKSKQSSMQVKRITHPRWVAPELLGEYRLSAASDVYSFGIIMYEMLTWQLPFHNLHKEQVVFNVLSEALRPEIPADEQLPPFTSSSTCLGNYKKLMQECWDQDPDKRPTFDKIAGRLKAMIRWRLVIQRLSPAATASASKKQSTAPAKGQSSKLDIATAVNKVITDKSAAAAAAASTVVEDDHEELPLPDHPIVQVPPHVEQQHAAGNIPAAAATSTETSVMLFTVARAGSAPPTTASAAAAASRSLSRLSPVEEHTVVDTEQLDESVAQSPTHNTFSKQQQQQQQSGTESSSTAVPLLPGSSHNVVLESSRGMTEMTGSDVLNSIDSGKHDGDDSSSDKHADAGSGGGDASSSSLCTPSVPTTMTTLPTVAVSVRSTEVDDTPYQASQTASGEVPETVATMTAAAAATMAVSAAAVSAFAAYDGVSDSSVPAGYPVPVADTTGMGMSPPSTAIQPPEFAVRQPPDGAAVADDNSNNSSSSGGIGQSYTAAADGGLVESSPAVAVAAPAALPPVLQHLLQQQQESAINAILSAANADLQQSDMSAAAAAAPVDRIPSWLQQQQQGMQLTLPVQQMQQMQQAAAAGVGQIVLHDQQHSELQHRHLTCDVIAEPGIPAAAAVAAAIGGGVADLQPVTSIVSPFLAAAAAASGSVLTVVPEQNQLIVPPPAVANAAVASIVSTTAAAPAAEEPVCHVAHAEEDLGAFASLPEQQQQQQQAQQQLDHFTAADSPFCWSFGAALDSGSAELPAASAFAAAAAAAPAAAAAGSSVCGAPVSTGALPTCLLSAEYLDDSKLPLDDDGPRLGAAVTVVYPEGQAVVDAAIGSSCTLKTPSGTTATSSNCTMPSLGEGVGALMRASFEGLPPTAAAVAGYAVSSTAAAEASPFAQSGFADDPCESIGLGGGLRPRAAAADAAHISMGASPFAAAVAAGGLTGEHSIAAPATSQGDMSKTALNVSMAPAAAAAAAGVTADGIMYPPWVYSLAAMNGTTAAAVSAAAAAGAFFAPAAASPGWTAGIHGQQHHHHHPALMQSHQRQPSWQVGDGGAGWMQGIAPQQQQGFVGFSPGNAGGGLVGVSNVLLQHGHLGLAGGQHGDVMPGTTDGRTTAAARRSSSASPELNAAWQQGSNASQQNVLDAADTSSAAADEEEESVLQYHRPLGEDILNRRLGTSDEDVTEQAKRALQAWEKTMKGRKTSTSQPDEGTKQQQQQQQPDGVSDLLRLSSTGDVAGRTASPAAAIIHPALLAQMMASPAAVAAGCGYPGVDPSLATAYLMNTPVPAAAGLGAKYQQSGISQLQLGDKVKVVNRPGSSYMGGMMDSNSMMMTAQQLHFMNMQNAAAGHHAWLSGGRPVGGMMQHTAQDMQQTFTPGAGLGQQQQQQQAEMMAALWQQQQLLLLQRGLSGAAPGPPSGAADGAAAGVGVSAGVSAVDAAAVLDRWSHAVTGSVGPTASPQGEMLMDTSAQQQQLTQQLQQQQQQQQLQSFQQVYMQQQQTAQQQQQQMLGQLQQQMVQQQLMQQHPQWQHSPQQQQQPPSPLSGSRPSLPIQGLTAAQQQQQQARLQRLPAQRR